jgi:hypothetical protein
MVLKRHLEEEIDIMCMVCFVRHTTTIYCVLVHYMHDMFRFMRNHHQVKCAE